ncbi:MAG TPA: nucleotidyltransferase domain-containing protein [Flavipsychrobacter sp.]|nr:nucleotidyltransferase domain-containing protein [Flavipsychrobacter sp.]
MLTIQQIKQTVTDYFKDKPVKRIYLFGSYARGEANEKSDVDLLVEYDDSKKRLSLFDVLRFKVNLEEKLHSNVELVEEGFLFEGFKPWIEKDKIQIYSA